MPGQPQNTPVVQKPTPVVLDQILIETSDSNKALYDRQLEYGHYHPDQIKYPGHRLLKQGPNAYGLYQYTWGNSLVAQDSYNVAKKYSAQSNAHPIFVRSYRVLRSDYLVTGPTTKLTAFTGIVAINVTNGGSGYTKDFAIGFTGGAGSGLAGIAIVNRGAVVAISLTNVGTGFTSAPTITFANGGGASAAATAIIQPATALLVEEEHDKLPEDDPYSSLYDRLTMVWETLPGPWIPFTRYDDQLGPIQGQRRAVSNTGQVSSLTSAVKTTYEGRNGSTIVLWEIQELFGAGVSGFSAYPILTGASRTVDVRNRNVDTSSTIVPHGTGPDVGSLNISSVVKDRNNQIADKTTVSVATLPPDEVSAYWDWVNLPLCILDIAHNIYCNLSGYATLTTNYDQQGGTTALRKHRRTTSYATSPPDTSPNLSTSAFETTDLSYQGKVIGINKSNVLNDAISYSANFSYQSDELCTWTEAYTFPATAPTATEFLAGAWYVKSYDPRPFGQSMWKITKEEYYSIQANPAI